MEHRSRSSSRILLVVLGASLVTATPAFAGPTATPTATPIVTPTSTPFPDHCEIDIKCSSPRDVVPRDDFCVFYTGDDLTLHYDFIGGTAEIIDSRLGVIGIYRGTTLTRTITPVDIGDSHTATFNPLDAVCITGIFSDSVDYIPSHPTPTPTATPTPSPTATPTPTSTPTPSATPDPCQQAWPVNSLVTIAKGQSAANNTKVWHWITGNIIDPGSLCRSDGVCTAHRIPVCQGTAVTVSVMGSTDNTNIGKGSISCNAAGCAVTSISVAEKYKSVSADGKDVDRVTFLPVSIGP